MFSIYDWPKQVAVTSVHSEWLGWQFFHLWTFGQFPGSVPIWSLLWDTSGDWLRLSTYSPPHPCCQGHCWMIGFLRNCLYCFRKLELRPSLLSRLLGACHGVCVALSQTSWATWKEYLPPVELPIDCTVCARFLGFVSCHPCWDRLWCHWIISIPLSNPSPIFLYVTTVKLKDLLSWRILMISIFWSVPGFLFGLTRYVYWLSPVSQQSLIAYNSLPRGLYTPHTTPWRFSPST